MYFLVAAGNSGRFRQIHRHRDKRGRLRVQHRRRHGRGEDRRGARGENRGARDRRDAQTTEPETWRNFDANVQNYG